VNIDRLGVPRIGSGFHPLTCEAIRAPRNPKAPHTPLSLLDRRCSTIASFLQNLLGKWS